MKALYHQTGKPPHACEAKKNADGTVDLSVGDQVIVTNCPVSKEPLDGHATLDADEKKAKEPDDKEKEKESDGGKDKEPKGKK